MVDEIEVDLEEPGFSTTIAVILILFHIPSSPALILILGVAKERPRSTPKSPRYSGSSNGRLIGGTATSSI